MRGIETVTCPKCAYEFVLSAALKEQIRKGLKDEVDKELDERLVEERLKAKKKAEEDVSQEMCELKESLEASDADRKKLKAGEIELRKKQKELKEAKEDIELETLRKLDEGRAAIQKEVEEKVLEERRLKDQETEKKMSGMKSQIDTLKRQAEQGSMETQGKVLELDFEARLRQSFPQDVIEPVKKGARGADMKHRVRSALGADCGMILWETKNTKAWKQEWISKLKDDAIEANASISVIVTAAMPKGSPHFNLVDGVWITDPLLAIPLANLLRERLETVSRERQAIVGKADKMEHLYEYLSGQEFKQRVEGILDPIIAMDDQLVSEQRAMEKQWSERKKQIERATRNVSGVYADMQGIIGGQIPSIAALELERPDNIVLTEGNYSSQPDGTCLERANDVSTVDET